ncbi:hypothetical protein [Sphingobacterium deserti]|uniref:DegT/DnrJ/EryC1/StrS aminotransferase n=1 Tax=Sphingobacterium deserti TaxID=1229276 RepID=A0A0B8T8A9_9SPHI|nr:hypothetical protein [Sphingobacterium deserti]KGE14145.1 hypothetical protein DI53_1975 [Sphingobacterium deserti]
MKKAIGGYFGIELPIYNNGFFNNSKNLFTTFLNSGRNAFEYILILKQVRRIHIPYYTCDVLLEPLLKLNIAYEFYDVNDRLEPIFNFNQLSQSDFFLYTNYFGLKTAYIQKALLSKIPNLIVDNAQALFANPIEEIYQFYSPRKFLGLPDGGIVVGPDKLSADFERDISYQRMAHLIKRLDLSAEDGYEDFKINDSALSNQPIKQMSHITENIFLSTDLQNVTKARIENFDFLHANLSQSNGLSFERLEGEVPMVYPFRSSNLHLRDRLAQDRIYCAKYWPNVYDWCDQNKNSYWLTEEIIAIPIDQRYNIDDMKTIVSHVQSIN